MTNVVGARATAARFRATPPCERRRERRERSALADGASSTSTRHRGQINFLTNLMAALCAYQLRSRKPAAAVRGLA
jgi:hypothetical protein